MKTSNQGFTLIELVVVMAIIGILAAIAIPKYIDLTDQARKAHDQGILAGLRSATVMMYASNILVGASATNSAGTYWPTEAQVKAQMSETPTWMYWISPEPSYNLTNGVWTTP